MTEKLEDLQARAAHPAALHGCSSNPCGSVVCQTARDRDALLSHVESYKQELDAAERQIAARTGETAAERLWRGRAEKAEKELQLAKAECTRQKQQKGILFRRTSEAEQALAKIREAAADNEAAPGMSQDYADGYSNALDKITDILDSDTPQKDPTPAPLGAAEIVKTSSVREAHEIETRRNAFTREEWLHCSCSWTSAKVLAEGMNWETEKLLHIMDALAEE